MNVHQSRRACASDGRKGLTKRRPVYGTGRSPLSVSLLRIPVLLVLFLLFVPVLPALSAPSDLIVGVEDGWIWQVALLPPEDGWESEAGRSALGAVRYAERKVQESPDGVSGRDIRFHQEEALEEASAAARVEDWRKRGISAVLSFAGGREIAFLRPHLGEAGPVFLSAFGETANIYNGEGVPDTMVFALDLFRDFRIAAFTAYAAELFPSGSVLAVLGDKLDPALERYSRNLGDMFFDRGFLVAHFWIPGGGMDSFKMIESEAIASGAKALVSWAGSMVVRDVWRSTRRKSNAFEIWYGGVPQPLLLSFNGVVTADQDYPVRADSALKSLGRDIWRRHNVTVKDPAIAGRAYAACQWLFDAFKRAGSPVPAALAGMLPLAEGLVFGSQALSINPATHRPAERAVAFMIVEGREFHPVKTLLVRGPDYLP